MIGSAFEDKDHEMVDLEEGNRKEPTKDESTLLVSNGYSKYTPCIPDLSMI